MSKSKNKVKKQLNYTKKILKYIIFALLYFKQLTFTK